MFFKEFFKNKYQHFLVSNDLLAKTKHISLFAFNNIDMFPSATNSTEVLGKVIQLNMALPEDKFDSSLVELWFPRPNSSKHVDCAYWHEEDEGQGSKTGARGPLFVRTSQIPNPVEEWRRNGVTNFSKNETHFGCRTSHLTNFATVYFIYGHTRSTDTVGLEILTWFTTKQI